MGKQLLRLPKEVNMAKNKVSKFNRLDKFDAWEKAQKKNSHDRKEMRAERRRLKKGG